MFRGSLESIEHGEASVNTALNLIVVAHVTHLFLEVYTPFDEPEWTDALKDLRPKIKNSLKLCHNLLVDNHPDSAQNEDVSVDLLLLTMFLPYWYGLQRWSDISYLPFPLDDYRFLDDCIIVHIKAAETLGEVVKLGNNEVSCLLEYLNSTSIAETSTSWHHYMARDEVRALGHRESIEFDLWCETVDLCADMVHRSEWIGIDYPDDEHGIDTSEIRLPPTSAEYWAWEFGRVAAMWSIVDKSFFADGEPSEYDAFHGWDNGFTALSLLSGAKESGDDLIRTYWIGALCTWRSEPVQDEVYASDLLPIDHLLWLMRLGAVDGALKLELRNSDSPAVAEPSGAFMITDTDTLEHLVRVAVEKIDRGQGRRIESELTEKLGKVWHELPLDAQEYLRDAELRLKQREWRDASLDYANSVEAALLEWLRNL